MNRKKNNKAKRIVKKDVKRIKAKKNPAPKKGKSPKSHNHNIQSNIHIKNSRKNFPKDKNHKSKLKRILKKGITGIHAKKTRHVASNVISGKKEKKIQAKKIVIVHGWDGDISKGWFPWLKTNLESKGFRVIMKQMPNPSAPKIDEWTNAIKDMCGRIDENTYFIGHSIGCQAILRMLEKHEPKKASKTNTSNIKNMKTGGAVFIAGWFELKEDKYKKDPIAEKQTREIAKPWVETEIDFSKIQEKLHPGKITAIFSDDDPYVDIKNAELFKQKLGARILLENGKKHYEEDNISEIPLLIEEVMRISSKEIVDKQ